VPELERFWNRIDGTQSLREALTSSDTALATSYTSDIKVSTTSLL